MQSQVNLRIGRHLSRWLAFSLLLLLSPALAFAQKPNVISETGQDRFQAAFPAGGQLRMHIRSSGVRISGSNENKIVIRFSVPSRDALNNVRVQLKQNGNRGDLDITGGPSNNFQIDIDIPRQSDLYVRMFAGELDIDHVDGNKDLEIHAGQMDISLPNANDYGPVKTSVTTGDLEASAYGVSKGGLFRTFRSNTVPNKNSAGRYFLYAHVGAGELDIN
ncbi:MAG TPA: hypothetical protein VGU63_05755 [Candidatus Acidoferrales bacterium]|nr:hypothetical protein [Candidatus Acidoferrales bacterium]